ncbi:hypothetical protein MU1_38000 [Paenibacillus glycanilyticus]|uniref:Uncharacterized protein n=1 Tax=Paenibacillus glycanilyticus TaxID=126569 RepID=A0ABQ6GGR5_9BACL|nr:hypothetical protein MU1_38000 [Paenibacillus glycanilyticus]
MPCSSNVSDTSKADAPLAISILTGSPAAVGFKPFQTYKKTLPAPMIRRARSDNTTHIAIRPAEGPDFECCCLDCANLKFLLK